MTDHHSLLKLKPCQELRGSKNNLDLSAMELSSQRLPRAVSKLRLPRTVNKLRLPRTVTMTQRLHGACGVPRVLEEVGLGRERPPSWMYLFPFSSAVLGRPAF